MYKTIKTHSFARKMFFKRIWDKALSQQKSQMFLQIIFFELTTNLQPNRLKNLSGLRGIRSRGSSISVIRQLSKSQIVYIFQTFVEQNVYAENPFEHFTLG